MRPLLRVGVHFDLEIAAVLRAGTHRSLPIILPDYELGMSILLAEPLGFNPEDGSVGLASLVACRALEDATLRVHVEDDRNSSFVEPR